MSWITPLSFTVAGKPRSVMADDVDLIVELPRLGALNCYTADGLGAFEPKAIIHTRFGVLWADQPAIELALRLRQALATSTTFARAPSTSPSTSPSVANEGDVL